MYLKLYVSLYGGLKQALLPFIIQERKYTYLFTIWKCKLRKSVTSFNI